MALVKSWALEELDVNTSATDLTGGNDGITAPEVDSLGAQNADMAAPADGSLFDDPRVEDGETVALEMPPKPHEDVVTDASSIHQDFEAEKEAAMAAPDSDNNDEEYTPPPAPEAPIDDAAEDAEEAELDVEEESDADGIEDGESDEVVTDPSDDDEAGDVESEDEDFGDADTVTPDDELVETDEADVNEQEADLDNVEDVADDIEADAEELEKLKNVVTESLALGGLSATAANVAVGRLNAISERWQLNVPNVGVENFNDPASSYQQTVRLHDSLNIACEGMLDRVGDWVKAKTETATSFITSFGKMAGTSVLDSKRKAEHLNKLPKDWESDTFEIPEKVGIVGATDINKLLSLCKSVLATDIESVVSGLGSDYTKFKGFVGAKWTDKQLHVGGTVALREGMFSDFPNVDCIKYDATPATGKFGSMTLRDLNSVTSTYAELANALDGKLVKTLKDSPAVKSLVDKLNAAFAGDDQEAIKAAWFEWSIAANTMIAYYKFAKELLLANKALIETTLKHPRQG